MYMGVGTGIGTGINLTFSPFSSITVEIKEKYM